MTFLSGEKHLESALCNQQILNDLEQAYQHAPVHCDYRGFPV